MRDAYDDLLHARIEALYESIEHHEAHLESTESTSMESHVEALRQLKEKRHHVDGLVQQLKEAGEHGSEQIRQVLHEAVDELSHAVDAARARLRGGK